MIFDLQEFKERELVLKDRQTARQAEVDDLKAQIEVVARQIEEDALTDDEKSELRIRGTELEGRLQGFAAAAQAAMNAEMQQLTSEMYTKLTEEVGRVAQRMNIDLVLVDDSSLRPPQAIGVQRIIYRNNRLDITQIVLNEMNAAFAAGANP